MTEEEIRSRLEYKTVPGVRYGDLYCRFNLEYATRVDPAIPQMTEALKKQIADKIVRKITGAGFPHGVDEAMRIGWQLHSQIRGDAYHIQLQERPCRCATRGSLEYAATGSSFLEALQALGSLIDQHGLPEMDLGFRPQWGQ